MVPQMTRNIVVIMTTCFFGSYIEMLRAGQPYDDLFVVVACAEKTRQQPFRWRSRHRLCTLSS